MKSSEKKIYKSFITIIVILIIIVVLVWLFWADIRRIIIGKEYVSSTIPEVGATLNLEFKQNILSQLDKLRQYGEWPIAAVRSNSNRGNPFEQK